MNTLGVQRKAHNPVKIITCRPNWLSRLVIPQHACCARLCKPLVDTVKCIKKKAAAAFEYLERETKNISLLTHPPDGIFDPSSEGIN